MHLPYASSSLSVLATLAIFFQTLSASPVVTAAGELQGEEVHILHGESHSQPLVQTQLYEHEYPELAVQGGFTIPSRYESTVLARRMLAKSGTGVLSTVFPKSHLPPYVPFGVATTPIGLPDYIASCEEPTGNPTLLALRISTSTRNAVAGSNVSLALSWWDSYVELTGQPYWSTANLPRASLIGYLEEMSAEDVKKGNIVDCFVDKHYDAGWWLPGDKTSPHRGVWMRLVVQEIYWDRYGLVTRDDHSFAKMRGSLPAIS